MKRIFLISTLFVLTVWLTACSDNEDFSADASRRLTFVSDTIRMDTVFSRIPTSTKSFWVYNRSGSGIRCRNIRLENGNQMGFRVTVDGIYLSQSAGYQVNDIEVRNGDSIRVFVELTSTAANQATPKEIEDNLIFQLESGVRQTLRLNAWIWDAEVWRDKVVRTDTVIRAEKPVIVYGSLKVEEGATLTLTAGTTLYFHDGAGMDVFGTLKTQGTPDNNVVMRGDRLDRMFDNLPYDRISGHWEGIRFHEHSYHNVMDYTDIHSAKNGIVCDSSSVETPKLLLRNSMIHNCKGYGLKTIHSQVKLLNSQLSNTLHDCLYVLGGVVDVVHCTIAQFYPFDAERGAALTCSNYEGDYKYPVDRLSCINSIVTGYADDVIYLLSRKDDTDTPLNYSFSHCLLRTPQPEEPKNMTGIIWENTKEEPFEGSKNFRTLDTDRLYYDFRLDSLSRAVDSGEVLDDIKTDRLGIARDDKPDLGCYEYRKE